MEGLITLAIWGALIFLMMRFGCGAHAMGHRGQEHGRGDGSHAGDRLAVLPEKDRDPVCGETVRTASAKSSVHEGRIYHFCSRDCREIFEAAPDLYLSDARSPEREPERSHA